MGAAYAPALTSVDDWQWSSNLIGFNAVSSYGSPSYHVQKMFGTTVGDHVVPTTLSGGSGLTHVATRTAGVAVTGGFHSLRATTPGFTDRYVRHQSSLGVLSQISASSPVLDRQDATFDVVPGLADNSCYSFESRNFPGRYLRHNDYRVKLAASDGSAVFNADATFCAKAGVRFQSYNFPDMYLRHYNSELWIASNGGARPSDNPANYVADTTWVVAAPLG
ncbi:AbfB domain-containing protein [Dactylosporangium sp. NPDC050588]|uniref:AbfB domain-containing protein n=1 Tax=Dactylosporangium sp. NPDC050588 TaxID=3157211 RepID=UPI0033EAB4DA